MNTKYILPQVLIAIVLWSISGFADYFDDQGNILGKFRTDYDSQTEGSAQNPLLIDTTGCDFPQSEFDTEIFIKVHATEACPTGPKIYPGGPFPYANISFSSSTFWVLSGNVELSFSDTNSAPLGNLQGPPNLSTNLNGTPDLLTFYMFPVFSGGFGSPPEKFTAQLIIDNEGGAAGKFSAAIPFIGLGGQKNRGNLGRVGSMNEIGVKSENVLCLKKGLKKASSRVNRFISVLFIQFVDSSEV